MIHAASEWGRELRSIPPKPGTVTALTLHWVGSGSYNRTPDQIPAGIKQIEQGQFSNPTMSAISYNYLVDKYGGIWEGRGHNYRNAANGKNANNTTSMSVCVLVGRSDATPTTKTIAALRRLWQLTSGQFGRPLTMQCHSDVRATACPGPELTSLVRSGAITNAGGLTVTRLQGSNRYETAAEVSRYTFPNGAPVVVVASGVSFPDALVAAPFGVRGPILLTERDKLPISTATEIKRLGAREVIIVGGVTAVSLAVENELRRLVP